MEERMRNSGIGGQAVIEGVMMKNKDQCAVAVRKPDHEIEIKKETRKSLRDRYKAADLPVIRGIVTFVESLVMGMQTLNYSSSFFEEEEEEKERSEEEKKRDEKKESILMGVIMVFSILFAIGLFVLMPFFVSEALRRVVRSAQLRGLIEGVIRVVLFIAYVKLISYMEDIRRVFMYHGAEHKSINCIENGLELTVDNVRKQSMAHKRCGTSFMLFVMLISILFFMFIVVGNMWLRMALRILLIPVIAGLSYEFIRFAGSHDNPVVNALSKPGLWLQSLTTREPDDEMIEVAIASVEAVFDWRAFLAEEGQTETGNKKKTGVKAEETPESKEKAEAKVELKKTERKPEEKTGAEPEPKVQKTEKKPVKPVVSASENSALAESAAGDMEMLSLEDEGVDEEEDEILKALDRYFEAPEPEGKPHE